MPGKVCNFLGNSADWRFLVQGPKFGGSSVQQYLCVRVLASRHLGISAMGRVYGRKSLSKFGDVGITNDR